MTVDFRLAEHKMSFCDTIMNTYGGNYLIPKIPGLRVFNPGISRLAKFTGIPGFEIPWLQSLCTNEVAECNSLHSRRRLLVYVRRRQLFVCTTVFFGCLHFLLNFSHLIPV